MNSADIAINERRAKCVEVIDVLTKREALEEKRQLIFKKKKRILSFYRNEEGVSKVDVSEGLRF